MESENAIIVGNGGAGKTFFMRHLWLSLFKRSDFKTPIFLELRALSDLSKIDLKNYIRLAISSSEYLPEDVFDYFCNRGSFVFILDEFDELQDNAREYVQNQILELSSLYRNCRFVVSSRYDRRFSGWQGFSIFQSEPFDLLQSIELVKKVPFDENSKALFIKKLDTNLYNSHSSFISSPLLCIMMMMTFKDNMTIPSNMSIFYDNAFTTLFQWHDATKAFHRKRCLNIDEFRRSFSIFCLLSYYEGKIEFSESEIIEYIIKTNKVLSFKFDPYDIKREYVESVNLLRQDGLIYVFIHRSFQEYFAALALTSTLSDKFNSFISRIKRHSDDNVIQLAFELNKNIVIKEYIRPEYNNFLSDSVIYGNENGLSILSKFNITYEYRSFGDGFGIFSLYMSDFLFFCRHISRIKDNLNSISRPISFNFNRFSVESSFEKFVKRSKIAGDEIVARITFLPNKV